MSTRHFHFNRALVIVLSVVFCAASSGVLSAADPREPLRVKVGGKEVEMPDTSDASRGLDLSGFETQLLYEADFRQPLKVVSETSLFSGERRTPVPAGTDWVLEGQASAKTEDGRLVLKNDQGHLVLWSTRPFPADVLIEFGVSPLHSDEGLNIVFFAAKGRDGGSIFAENQPMRGGEFKKYHSGEINCYHASYWATSPGGEERGTSHIRKNMGFHLVAMGRDFIARQGTGPHRVRVLKVGPEITVEVAGKIAVHWKDDGAAFGPVLGDGLIGLRQMAHTGECGYPYFKVSSVRSK